LFNLKEGYSELGLLKVVEMPAKSKQKRIKSKELDEYLAKGGSQSRRSQENCNPRTERRRQWTMRSEN